ncbi:MAG: hypothetical protein NVS3B18_14850 [Candidatus Dormibacteria bacterium]
MVEESSDVVGNALSETSERPLWGAKSTTARRVFVHNTEASAEQSPRPRHLLRAVAEALADTRVVLPREEAR